MIVTLIGKATTHSLGQQDLEVSRTLKSSRQVTLEEHQEVQQLTQVMSS